MKKIIPALILVLAIVLTYSCKNQTKESLDENTTVKATKATEEHHAEGESITLDNGNRWIANPETTIGVEKMQQIMDSFTEKENVDAYKKLTENLQVEFKMIFEKCTMTGAAHDQLHNFLIPIKDLLKTLPSSDLKECQESFDQINKHLLIYKTYFK